MDGPAQQAPPPPSSSSSSRSKKKDKDSKRDKDAAAAAAAANGSTYSSAGYFIVNRRSHSVARVAADVLCSGIARDAAARDSLVYGGGTRRIMGGIVNCTDPAAGVKGVKVARPMTAMLALCVGSGANRSSSSSSVGLDHDSAEEPGGGALAVSLAKLLLLSMEPLCSLEAPADVADVAAAAGGRAEIVDRWRPLAEGSAASLRWLAHTLATRGASSSSKAPPPGQNQNHQHVSASHPPPAEALSTEALQALTAAVRMAAGASDVGAESGSSVISALAALAESATLRAGAAALMNLGAPVGAVRVEKPG